MRTLSALFVCSMLTACGSKPPVPPPEPPSEMNSSDPLITACDSGVVKSCLAAGEQRERAADLAGAAELYGRACELGDPGGCVFAGGILIEQPGQAGEAAELFEKACGLGEGTGCYGAGLVWEGGYGDVQDFSKAFSAYGAGCSAGLFEACGRQGVLYAEGRGVAKSDDEAEKAFRGACEKGDPTSCIELAQRYETDAAAPLLEKACNVDGRGCTRRAYLAMEKKDDAGARHWFAKGCTAELPDLESCAGLGWATWAGIGGSPDEPQGRAMLQDACGSGAAMACTYSAVVATAGGDSDAADQFLERACGLDAPNCDAMRAKHAELAAGK